SIIRCEARALAEVVDAPDSHVTLRYDSRRSPGRTASTTVRVPLPDEAAVAGLRRITVEVTVAGVTQQQTFTADEVAATGEAVFTWDGRDAFGRAVLGTATATVAIVSVFDTTYAEGTFGDWPTTTGPDGTPIDVDTGVVAREGVVDRQVRTVIIGHPAPAADIATGWGIDGHHRSARAARRPELGAGSTDVAPGGPALWLHRPTGWGDGDVGDPAITASVPHLSAAAVAADGTIYLAECTWPATSIGDAPPGGCRGAVEGQPSGRLLSIAPDGVLRAVAAPAGLVAPADLAVTADGTLLVADAGAHVVHAIPASGDPYVLAGTPGENGLDG